MLSSGAAWKGVLAAIFLNGPSVAAETLPSAGLLLRRERDHEIADSDIFPVVVDKPLIEPVTVVPDTPRMLERAQPSAAAQVDTAPAASDANQVAAQAPVEPTIENEDPEDKLKNDGALPAAPPWAQQGLTHAGLYMLPYQPPCQTLIGNDKGASDHGRNTVACEACEQGCTSKNMQPPIDVDFQFVPALRQKPATDIMMLLEFESVKQISPFANNGVYHRMNFGISGGCGGNFLGEMGPQVQGGVGLDDRLMGRHLFSITDVELSQPNGNGVLPGRYLAVPGKKEPGHIGLCRRHCINCGRSAEPGEGKTTGTLCTSKVGIKNQQQFVYRLFQTKKEEEVLYDGISYHGTLWEVRIIDPFQGANYILGTIVTEGTHTTKLGAGITSFSAKHEHIGCAPCDAYYQALRSSGPFVLQPRGQHELKQATELLHARAARDATECEMNRLVSLGGYSLLYESGPGVRINRPNTSQGDRVLFKCPLNL